MECGFLRILSWGKGSERGMIGEKKLVALCTSRVYDPQVYGFMKELNELLQPKNCVLLVFTINSDIYWEEDLNPAETYVFDIMPFKELDCVVIMDEKIKSHSVAGRIVESAKKEDVPVVIVDGEYEGTIHVNFDYAAGFEEITRHVIEEHKVKHPHMMAGLPNNFFSEQRIEIFKKVIEENGIPFDESMVSYGDFWADPTREAMRLLLTRKELPDAIICANDIMAINVCDMLQQAGIKIPDQVIVSGFDGYDEVFFADPKICTSSCDTVHLAEATGEIVLRIVDHEEVRSAFIAPKLIPNQSCGCPEHHYSTALNQMANFNNNFYRHQDDTRILYNISSNMETSRTAWEMAASIHDHKTKNLLTVVDHNVFDMEESYFMTEGAKKKPNFHLINDADYAEEHRFERIPLPKEIFYDETVNEEENVLSGNYRQRTIELFDTGYPLVYHALDYMNQAFGFNCYFFRESVITNYSKAAIVTNAISMGIGGFVNLQYQRRLLEKMDAMYKHDALTGLYNRIGFHKVYDEISRLPENQGKPVTVIMSDMDGLKYINDNFGHADGDQSIAAVANALKKACPEHAISARFGGDELFAVIIGECDADAIMKQIDEYLKEYNDEADLPYTVATSSGYYRSTLTESFDVLKALKRADERMYIAKNGKRHRYTT